MKKRTRKKKTGLIPVIILAFILVMSFFSFNFLFGVANKSDDKIILEIPKGSSVNFVATSLKEKGLINNKNGYKLYLKVKNEEKNLKAGNYQLQKGMSLKEITDIFTSGQSLQTRFTVLEGESIKEIADKLSDKKIIDKEKFLNLLEKGDFSEYDFLKNLPKGKNRLEGYLFPDTYTISEGSNERTIIKVMLDRFEDVLNKMPKNKSELSLHELVNLASIVEHEAALDKERDLVASVFLNRLDINMPLQSCATIQYILPERKAVLLTKDLKIESPYNTYLHKGLPPGPIGNPGEASLHAVANAISTDYLYFNAKYDGTKEHYFSKNHDEHVANKAKSKKNQNS